MFTVYPRLQNCSGALILANQHGHDLLNGYAAITYLASESTGYQALIIAEAKRRAAWHPSRRWLLNQAELLTRFKQGHKDQVALIAAEMAAEELPIKMPAVRMWYGHEPKAAGKLGWVFGDAEEINIVLNQSVSSLLDTAAHECRHLWQFKNFSGLTRDQRESDAQQYASDFSSRAFPTY